MDIAAIRSEYKKIPCRVIATEQRERLRYDYGLSGLSSRFVFGSRCFGWS